jgi:hypothetical protein
MDNEPDLYPLEEPKKHKRPGRPPGSVQQRAMLKRFQEIYDKIKGMLNDEQRSYYEKVFSGRAKFDAVKLSELFMLQFSLYTASVLDEAIENKKISEGLAQTLAQYRMGLKDVEDMHRKREELEAKKDANGKSVDPTRESSESRLDELIARASQGAKK